MELEGDEACPCDPLGQEEGVEGSCDLVGVKPCEAEMAWVLEE